VLTIVLSGPKASVNQARTALATAGVGDVQSVDHDHGLPPQASGDEIREAQGFITLMGEDIDAATRVASALGWRLRLHFPTPEPPQPTEAEQLHADVADLKAQVADLKARLA
jgi:hypothetical protein